MLERAATGRGIVNTPLARGPKQWRVGDKGRGSLQGHRCIDVEDHNPIYTHIYEAGMGRAYLRPFLAAIERIGAPFHADQRLRLEKLVQPLGSLVLVNQLIALLGWVILS